MVLRADVELWNEPPWANDPWDDRKGLYDPALYSGPDVYGANFGFAANIMRRHFPEHVTATWNGTSGNGSASLLGPKMEHYSGEPFVQPSPITKESFHPYNGAFSNPENMMFVVSCLEGAAAAKPGTPAANPFANGANCYLPGVEQTANGMEAVRLDRRARLANPSGGIGHSITETNALPPKAGLKERQAQAVLRQFIGFEADGLSPMSSSSFGTGDKSILPSASSIKQVLEMNLYPLPLTPPSRVFWPTSVRSADLWWLSPEKPGCRR